MDTTKDVLIIPNPRTSIKWTRYTARGIAEGFLEYKDAGISEDEDSHEVEIEAWAVIIKYQLYKVLQGWFGRNAADLISNKLIAVDGTINWQLYDNDNNDDDSNS